MLEGIVIFKLSGVVLQIKMYDISNCSRYDDLCEIMCANMGYHQEAFFLSFFLYLFIFVY